MTAEGGALRLRPSHILKLQDCARAYQLQYVDGIRPKNQSINLYFGTALHHVYERIVKHDYKGMAYDPASDFEAILRTEVAGKTPSYPKGFSFESYLEMGKVLCQDFQAKWPRLGLHPLVDDLGEPITELRLKAPLGQGVELTGTIDLPCLNRDMQTVVIDYKTARSPANPRFVYVSDQLTAYQILLDANADEIGISPVSKLGFIEALKRKVPKNGASRGTGPYVEEACFAPRRTAREIADFKKMVLWYAEMIRKGHFPRTARMGFNTPCAMCDFAGLCIDGDTSGLIVPSQFGVGTDIQVSVSRKATKRPTKRRKPACVAL